jgi:hypothetical protein
VEVSEVALLQGCVLKLVENGQDVMERPDERQRLGFRRAMKAA